MMLFDGGRARMIVLCLLSSSSSPLNTRFPFCLCLQEEGRGASCDGARARVRNGRVAPSRDDARRGLPLALSPLCIGAGGSGGN